MKLGFIIICRYSSRRLPGKILKELQGKPILQYIFERLAVVVPKENIVVATSVEDSDIPIIEYCKRNSINYFKGPLNNVAQRFLECGEQYSFDYIARINGDNILVDIESVKEMIQVARTEKYDFISNVKNRTFPKGMSIEIVKTKYYKRLYQEFYSEGHFEHVTQYLYTMKDQNNHFYYYNTNCPEAAGIQLAIDNKQDFALIEKIISNFERDHINYGLHDIYEIYKLVRQNG
ncbi:MAG: hypothetical protein KQH79_00330 [Bacteroidetes bacterium]|nr:hypothetical protein [Bacteroidota bacterium]